MLQGMQLEGIHHITAITGDAQRNLDFYTRVLGLRLAAKTVNQDDPTVYHLFYASERGEAGSDITFFESPGAIPGRAGAGMIHRIVHRVGSAESLRFWADRLGVPESEGSVVLADPEGLEHELVVNTSGDEPLVATHPEIPAEHALQGFEGVRAYSDDTAATRVLLEQVMNARPVDEDRWEVRGARRGGWIAYDPAPMERGRQSAGTVHHIAWGTTVAEHPKWEEHLTAAGIPTSGIIDRHYFHSIYYREPSGVLFEIADDAPGFTVDVPLDELGSKIILPPRFEPQREEIERRLTPLPDPRAGWPSSV